MRVDASLACSAWSDAELYNNVADVCGCLRIPCRARPVTPTSVHCMFPLIHLAKLIYCLPIMQWLHIHHHYHVVMYALRFATARTATYTRPAGGSQGKDQLQYISAQTCTKTNTEHPKLRSIKTAFATSCSCSRPAVAQGRIRHWTPKKPCNNLGSALSS